MLVPVSSLVKETTIPVLKWNQVTVVSSLAYCLASSQAPGQGWGTHCCLRWWSVSIPKVIAQVSLQYCGDQVARRSSLQAHLQAV